MRDRKPATATDLFRLFRQTDMMSGRDNYKKTKLSSDCSDCSDKKQERAERKEARVVVFERKVREEKQAYPIIMVAGNPEAELGFLRWLIDQARLHRENKTSENQKA
jgi:hypothetical protein